MTVWIPTRKVNDPTIVLLTDATRKTQRVWKGAACGVCGPGKGLRQGAKGTNLVLARGVPEAYINIIRDMYAGCKTSVMTSAGKTKEIEIEVGLHQGSALSPLLFVIIIDVITEEIDEGTPWAMLFADDLVLCDTDRQMMELRLERWRECMEKNGLKVSRAKTEHLQTPGDTDPVRMKRYMETEMVNLLSETAKAGYRRRTRCLRWLTSFILVAQKTTLSTSNTHL